MLLYITGRLHRVYSVTTLGVCYCPNNVIDSWYVWYTFSLRYSGTTDITDNFASALASDAVTNQVSVLKQVHMYNLTTNNYIP